MITVADIGFGFLEMLLAKHGQKLPAELVTAAQAAVDSWAQHRNDVVTKAAVDAARA